MRTKERKKTKEDRRRKWEISEEKKGKKLGRTGGRREMRESKR